MADWVGDDCQHVGDFLVFPKANTKSEALAIIGKAADKGVKPYGTICKAAIEGTELDQLKAKYPDVAYSKGVVYKFGAANTLVDRHVERFSVEVLQKFAKDINENSRTFDWQHISELFGLANAIHAEVVPHSKMAGEYEMIVWALVFKSSTVPMQHGRNLVEAIEEGAVNNVSVKFRGWTKGEETNFNGENRYVYTYYIDPKDPYTLSTELISIGFVDLGAQIGSTRKSAQADQLEFINEFKNMTKSIVFEVAGVSHTLTIDVAGEAITVKGDAELTTAIKSAIDTSAAKITDLQKSIDTLSAPLIADVVNAKIPGLDEATVKCFAPDKLIATAGEATKGVKIVPKETEKAATKYPQIFKREENV